MFGSLGTATNSAVQAYLNGRKVPQLFVTTGASKWNDPQNHPWTMGFQPNYHTEAQIYANYILQTKPNAKIGVLYQNDDYGKDYLKGVKDGLGEKTAKMLVAELAYEVTDATIDSQILQMQALGVDVVVDATSPKFAAQAIRKAYDIGWKPVPFPEQHVRLGRQRVDARGPRKVDRLDHEPVSEGPDRSEVGCRRRNARVARFHESLLSRRKPG